MSIDATFFIVQVMVMLFVTLLYLMLFVTILAFFHWIFSRRERLGLAERRELRQFCACGVLGRTYLPDNALEDGEWVFDQS